MQYLGNSIHEKKIHISSFYTDDNGMPIPSSEIVGQLAFVFRNGDGSTVGRAADGSDIYVPLYQGGFGVVINVSSSQPILWMRETRWSLQLKHLIPPISDYITRIAFSFRD